MKKIIPVLLAAAVTVPAGAQQFEKSVGSAMTQIRLGSLAMPTIVRKGEQHSKRVAALDSTMVAMNDGPEQGGAVVSFVKQNNVEIRFEDQNVVSRTDGKNVVLDWMIAPYPRAIGPRVAWEVSAMMLQDMPDCSEKEYMRRSVVARVWLELGGEPSKLPVVEPLTGDKDEALSREMKLWLDSPAELALDNIGEATGTKSLLEQLYEERDPAKREALKAANKRFTEFLLAENDWRKASPR